MNSDKDGLDTVLENPCHAHLLPGSSSAIVTTTSVKKEKSSNRRVPHYLLILTLSSIIILQLIALVYLLCEKFISVENSPINSIQSQNTNTLHQHLFREVSSSNETRNKEAHRDNEIQDYPEEYLSDHDMDYFLDYNKVYDDATNAATVDSNLSVNYEAPWDMYNIEPRCFSMCEPPELFFRDDKLIKTVVVHNGHYPIRYYMFLFPDAVNTSTNLGEPLLLSPLIENGQVTEARKLSRVKDLNLPHEVESHSGFITVNKTSNSNLFFWYFPAENGNKSAPFILWLQGGPGSSSMYGLLKENGPFIADVDKTGRPFIRSNPYRWSANHSVLYIDNPVGTGFSFTDHLDAYPKVVEESTEDLFLFLQQFLKMFPELQQCQFFPFGESYAGKYVPALAHRIHTENKKKSSKWLKINLAGIGIGNGWMSPIDQGKYASYLYYHGLLDKHQYDQLDIIDKRILKMIEGEKWLDAWKASDDQLNFILTSLNYSNLYDISKDQYRPSTMNFWSWLNTNSVRQAIHVGNMEFSDGLKVYMAMVEDTMRSVKPLLEEILSNYRVLNYNGALDIICHYPGTEEMYSRTQWPGRKMFLQSHREGWWVHNPKTNTQELAGFVKKGGNLRLVLVRNAGHSVPINQPLWALRLLEDFIHGRI